MKGTLSSKNKTLCLACGLWGYPGKWILTHPDQRVHSQVESADRTANNSGSRTLAGVRAFLGLGVALSKLEVSFAVWFLERAFVEGCREVQVHIQASPSGLATAYRCLTSDKADIDLAGLHQLSVIERAAKRKIIILHAGISALLGQKLLSVKNYLDRSFG